MSLSLFTQALLSRKISMHIRTLEPDIKSCIRKQLSFLFEGKCTNEGFIKRNSIVVVSHSAGRISEGINIYFDVVFSCDVCYPLDGMIVPCTATNITKAGIRAEVPPLIIFVARDHYYNSEAFSRVKVDDRIKIKVIGNRFELNDANVSVIAELVDDADT